MTVLQVYKITPTILPSTRRYQMEKEDEIKNDEKVKSHEFNTTLLIS